MGGAYIPNPQGTLPYKQSFGQVFGETMQAVAATISDYYEKKRTKAQQGAQTQLQLMQAGLGGNPRDLIRSLKQGYDINVTEESVRAIQAQAQVRAQMQQQQMQAQTEKAQAEAQSTQIRSKLETGMVEAASAGDMAKATNLQRVAGMIDPNYRPQNLFQAMTPEQQSEAIKQSFRQPIATLAQSLTAEYGAETATKIAEWMYTGGPPPPELKTSGMSPTQIGRVADISTAFAHQDGTPVTATEAAAVVKTGAIPGTWVSLGAKQREQEFKLRQGADRRAADEFMEAKKQYAEQKELRGKQLEETQERTALMKRSREEAEAEHKRIAQDHQAQKLIGVYRELIKNASGDDRRKLEVELVQQLRAMGYDIDAKIVGHWGLGWLGYGRRVETTRPSTETPTSAEDIDRLLR